MNIFEEEVKDILKSKGFEIKEKPKYVDLMIEKEGIKIAVEIKAERNSATVLPKAFGQLIAAKYMLKSDELWLILKEKEIHNPTYFKIFAENEIKVFTIENSNLIELKNVLHIHERRVRIGFDTEKLTKIWRVLAENNNWLHIAEISRRTGIDQCTVRWYLDHYLKNAVDEEKIVPTIRLRLVKLKPEMSLESYIMALKLIRKVKTDKVVKHE